MRAMHVTVVVMGVIMMIVGGLPAKWIAAGAGLSASWFLQDGVDADTRLAVAGLALSRLEA